MDRTLDFRECLRRHGYSEAFEATAPRIVRGTFVPLAEEQRARLLELRQQIKSGDADLKFVGECQACMSELESLAEDFTDIAASGGSRSSRDYINHRKGVVSALYEELKDLATVVQKTQVQELQMENEVATYFTAASRPAGSRGRRAPVAVPLAVPEETLWPTTGSSSSGPKLGADLDEERMRAEAQSLLTSFETDLDHIQDTQKKVSELSNMMNIIATKVTEQSEQVEQIHDLAEESTAYVEKAGDHLQQALKSQDSYKFYVMCWFIGSGIFLLVFDFIDSRFSLI